MASAGLAAAVYFSGNGWAAALGAVVGLVILVRSVMYLYFERLLAFRTYENFVSGKIRHECIACGASCHLRVNLGKDDLERILKHAKEARIQEIVVEKRGDRYWLKRKANGACVFLTYSENIPRCQIYSIRPIACRLYPLIPAGNQLKVDPFCPGLSQKDGHTFKEHLLTQEVGAYVRKALGRVDRRTDDLHGSD